MGFYIKNPMTRFYIITGITLFMFAVSLAALFTARFNNDECEHDSCEGEIEIRLIDLSDSDPFTITVAYPNGEIRTISCSAGGHNEEIPFSQSCWPTGAKFNLPANETPPEKITVTVEVSGKKVERVFPRSMRKNSQTEKIARQFVTVQYCRSKYLLEQKCITTQLLKNPSLIS